MHPPWADAAANRPLSRAREKIVSHHSAPLSRSPSSAAAATAASAVFRANGALPRIVPDAEKGAGGGDGRRAAEAHVPKSAAAPRSESIVVKCGRTATGNNRRRRRVFVVMA
jgi:hypothetical protein